MGNRNCYWCDYDINKIDTAEEGYYCTFNPDNKFLCPLDKVCRCYVAADVMPDYIRHMVKQFREMEQLLYKLP